MDQKKSKRWKYVIVGSCLLVVLLFLGTCTGGVMSPLPFLYMRPFHGQVIDAEAQEPITGAAVLALYYKSTPGVGGSVSLAVDAQETLTDSKGEFHIPSGMRWFSFYRGFTEERIIIFKPGYGAFPSHRESKEVRETKGTRSIVYYLPKLKTSEERKQNVRMRTFHEIPFEKQRFYVEAINAELESLGLPVKPVNDKEH